MDTAMKKRNITFRITICVEEDGDAFYAHCPVLAGVHIDGETRDEALKNAKLAVELYIQSLINHNEPIPLQIVKSFGTEELCQQTQSSTVFPLPRQAENILVTV